MNVFQLTRRVRPLLLGVLLIAAAALPTSVLSEDQPKLYVHLETPARFSYSGDPMQVSILFKNEGKALWVNPGLDIEGGFQVIDSDGKKLERAKTEAPAPDSQPKRLAPNAYFGQIVDLSALFPKISTIGTYRITWSAPGLPDQTLATRIIKKYDPKKDYQAVLETDFGKIVLDFYKDLAPYHVRNFIDLANLGFYDGLLFHRIIKGEAIFGGSPTGDERGSPGFTIGPEPNGLKVLPGTVAQVRNINTGADESGSIFMIAATAQPDLDSKFTVFARVSDGLETVKAIANVPTVGGAPRMPSRPIKDVKILKVTIREKKPAKAS
jgi:peptidyl-prolyl cis-trans isomerase B (cyclophilin B)